MPKKHDDSSVLQSVARRIKDLRNRKGWTQADFAEVLSTQPSNVSRLESGQENFKITRLERIADVLGVTLSELLAGDVADSVGNELGKLGFDVLSAGAVVTARDIAIWDLRPRAGQPVGRTREPVLLGWARPSRSLQRAGAHAILQVFGNSMAPLIPSGAWCLFRIGIDQLSLRLRVLARLPGVGEIASWVVKSIGAIEALSDDSFRVRLDSMNPSHASLWAVLDDGGDAELVAELVDVLVPPPE